jgi:hypothetical protein
MERSPGAAWIPPFGIITAIAEVTAIATNDKPYSNTTTELLFDLYHERNRSANNPIKETFSAMLITVAAVNAIW